MKLHWLSSLLGKSNINGFDLEMCEIAMLDAFYSFLCAIFWRFFIWTLNKIWFRNFISLVSQLVRFIKLWFCEYYLLRYLAEFLWSVEISGKAEVKTICLDLLQLKIKNSRNKYFIWVLLARRARIIIFWWTKFFGSEIILTRVRFDVSSSRNKKIT